MTTETITKKPPIPKKDYMVGLVKPAAKLFDSSYDQDLQVIFEKFFQRNKCQNFYQLSNFYSAFDAILTSGDTSGNAVSVPVEFKKRAKSVINFNSCIFERKKYDSLFVAKQLIAAPAAFYIMAFFECILIFNIEQDQELVWTSEVHRKDNTNSNEHEVKEVTYLPYTSATYIISTHSYERKTQEQLNDYIKIKRLKYYGE